MTPPERDRVPDLIPPPAGDTPRILLFDIETAPALAWVWGNYKTNVIATEQDWFMLCFAYRWLGQSQMGYVSLPQDPTWEANSPNDLYVVQQLAALFEQADATIAHYGDGFDTPKSNARYLYHGIEPPAPYQTIDTKKESSRYFAHYSNSLNELCRLLGIGKKLVHRGFDMWRDCIAGSPAAWVEMEEYNRHDIDLLEGLYLRLLPWIGHPGKGGGGPNFALYPHGDEEWTCPKCGTHRRVRNGTYRTRFSRYQAFKCANCGGWSRAPFREKGHAAAI